MAGIVSVVIVFILIANGKNKKEILKRELREKVEKEEEKWKSKHSKYVIDITEENIAEVIIPTTKLKLKNQNYSMINDNEVYQITSTTVRKLNASDSMLGKLFGYFFSE